MCDHAERCGAHSSSPQLLHHPLPPQGGPAGRKSKFNADVSFNDSMIVRYFQENRQQSGRPAIAPCQKSRLRLDHETLDFIPSPPSSRALHCGKWQCVWFWLTALSSVVVPPSCTPPVESPLQSTDAGFCINLMGISLTLSSKMSRREFSPKSWLMKTSSNC